MAPRGAVSIAELMLPDGAAATATITMATTIAPARPPHAGVGRLRGIMAPEAPTAPAEVPLRGVAALEAPQDSEVAPLPGVAAPALTTGLSAVPAPGVVGNPHDTSGPFNLNSEVEESSSSSRIRMFDNQANGTK
jgi:hypothetical protein